MAKTEHVVIVIDLGDTTLRRAKAFWRAITLWGVPFPYESAYLASGTTADAVLKAGADNA